MLIAGRSVREALNLNENPGGPVEICRLNKVPVSRRPRTDGTYPGIVECLEPLELIQPLGCDREMIDLVVTRVNCLPDCKHRK